MAEGNPVSPIVYAKMTKEEADKLATRVRNEVYRRSGFKPDGSYIHDERIRNYNGPILEAPDDEYFKFPVGDELIRANQGIPIIDKLIEVCDFGELRFVKELDTVPAEYDANAINKILDMLEADPFGAKYTHCRSACTGLCMMTCMDSCSGGCENACAECATACSAYCSGKCTGCTDTCGQACGITCGSSCSNHSTACSGCSSGCTGCTGCSLECSGECSSACIYTCKTSCIAGCFGSSGYNNTCGCGGSCTTGCGNASVAAASTTASSYIDFYHEGKLYGRRKVVSATNTLITLPTYDDPGEDISNLQGKSSKKQWIDDDGNRFEPGASVRVCIGNATQYTNYKNQGVLVTKSTRMRSIMKRYPFFVVTTTALSKDTRRMKTWKLKRTEELGEYIYDIAYDTPISVTLARDGKAITGASPTYEWFMTVNGDEVALPYSGTLLRGDKISFSGKDVEYTITEFDFKTGVTGGTTLGAVAVYPELDCQEFDSISDLGTSTPCELEGNENAKLFINGKQTTGLTLVKGNETTRTELTEPYTVGVDQDILGIGYTLRQNYYLTPRSNQEVEVYGSDPSIKWYLISATTGQILASVPLTRVTSMSRTSYTCTLPSLASLGLSGDVYFADPNVYEGYVRCKANMGCVFSTPLRQSVCYFLLGGA